jgi:acyl-CoA synthetase (AMP-forming)/AMP-acid ligase II
VSSVRDVMRQSARSFWDEPAVVAGHRRLSYGEAWGRGLRLANGLAALGLEPGDRVGVLEGNTLEASDFLVGTTIGGFVRVPLYAGSTVDTHQHMLAGTGCRAVVLDARWAEHAPAFAAAVGSERVLVRDGGYEGWLERLAADDPDPRLGEADLYVIRHTGGTTGKPKAVAYSNTTWLASCRDWFYGFPPVQPGDASLNVSPIAHGSAYFFTPVWLGGGVNVLLDGFDATTALDALVEHDISYVFVVPSMLDVLARTAMDRDAELPRLKVVAVAGAPLAAATVRRAAGVFGAVIHQVYGQTEAVPATLIGPAELLADGGARIRSAGRAFPFSQIKIRLADGSPASAGEIGEVLIKASGQMDGYFENEEATRRTVVDGWIRSGDAGYVDAEGYLFVLDRLADRIVVKDGELWPSQVEDAAQSVKGVREAAALTAVEGVLVVCSVDGTAFEREVADAVEAAVGVRPSVEFRAGALPKSPVGKLQRAVLSAEYAIAVAAHR